MKDTIWIKKGRFTPLAILLMLALPLTTSVICLCFGRMNVPVGEVLAALRTALTGGSAANVQNYSIVINLRLPRILMAIIVGAGLTCAGNTFQSLFSNPLATPDILGVTSGTCVGAILAIILSCSILETQLIALVFGLASVCFTLKIAGKNDGRSMVYLVLAGTIASSLFNAVGSLLKYTADPQDKLPEITYWLMGSFTSASYQKILIGCPLIIAGIAVIYLLRWRLNILSLSDDEARASGISIKQTRMLFILASTLITASAVSMCGQVGWIGLLIPHCARMLVGSNNRYVVPVSLSLGASFMILIDTLSRTISIIELPLSILTAIIGAPVFISLLNKTRSNLRWILQVQNGCFGYPGQPAILENIDLTLEEGHILAILGPNGIGKTTLLKCMIGLLPWHSGKTLLYGKEIHTLKPKEVWSTISYIPQSHGFAFSYTGLEMVLLGRSAHLGMFQQPGKEELEMAEAMMERVGISHLANKDCNRMSGGELQMVLIARALINDPKLIILDEPETGLDFHNQILVLNMVERLAHEEGISAIMNTHYPTNAMSVADEALMLNRKGEFFYGPAAAILNEQNISYSFDVQVIVDELNYQGRAVRSIVPVALRGNAV